MAGQVNVVRTNWVDHWYTNQIEVKMPLNHFVAEYRTNWVAQYRTNVVDLYLTNIIQRTLTNHVWVERQHTNWLAEYHTNWQTLNLTNWATVFAFKTNWVTQPLTNVVQMDLPVLATPAKPAATPASGLGHAQAAPGASPLLIEAKQLGQTSPGKLEVHLSVHWSTGPNSPLVVQQWRVEKDDGSVLCFGQDREFRRALPVGQYKVQVKAGRGENAPLLAALGTLEVMPRDVSLQQRTARVTN